MDSPFISPIGYSAVSQSIATDAITVTSSFHIIDTEGGAASDNLATINGGLTGDILILKITSGTRTVLIKHGTGNIHLTGNADLNMTAAFMTLSLVKIAGSLWLETGRGTATS